MVVLGNADRDRVLVRAVGRGHRRRWVRHAGKKGCSVHERSEEVAVAVGEESHWYAGCNADSVLNIKVRLDTVER